MYVCVCWGPQLGWDNRSDSPPMTRTRRLGRWAGTDNSGTSVLQTAFWAQAETGPCTGASVETQSLMAVRYQLHPSQRQCPAGSLKGRETERCVSLSSFLSAYTGRQPSPIKAQKVSILGFIGLVVSAQPHVSSCTWVSGQPCLSEHV